MKNQLNEEYKLTNLHEYRRTYDDLMGVRQRLREVSVAFHKLYFKSKSSRSVYEETEKIIEREFDKQLKELDDLIDEMEGHYEYIQGRKDIDPNNARIKMIQPANNRRNW